jgi:flagellar biosynthesis/type III secretory pathway chaperone
MIVEKVNQLIHALREELQQYGEMLARMDEQQELVMRRAADDLLQNVARVQEQGNVIQEARKHRELAQAGLAQVMRLEAPATFAQIIPLLPDAYRPLVGALVDENNALLTRIQHRAHQNHLLLSRSLELMQTFLSTLLPPVGTTVYGQNGTLFVPPMVAKPLLEAVG